MKKEVISTANAPAAIGPYSQAVRVGDTLYISGQIPLDPVSMELVSDDFGEQAHQVFTNLKAVAEAADASLSDAVKLTVYVVDLENFTLLNEVMSAHMAEPFPARAAVQVAALPKGAQVEVDAVLCLN